MQGTGLIQDVAPPPPNVLLAPPQHPQHPHYTVRRGTRRLNSLGAA
ncbi:hypothetical protein [Pseudarthrobacter sp. LT1]|nr:hypothetical protein [Pseudarthrobacter sp. LT1]WRT16139.1 hypothetical protein VIK36_12285 [Pseudarthrobacter sp. LT1]